MQITEEHIHGAYSLPASKSQLFITTRKCIQSTFVLINSCTHSLVFAVSVESNKVNQANMSKFNFSQQKQQILGLNLSKFQRISKVNDKPGYQLPHSYQVSHSVLIMISSDKNNIYCINELQ